MKKDLTEFVARLKLLLIAMVLIVGSCMEVYIGVNVTMNNGSIQRASSNLVSLAVDLVSFPLFAIVASVAGAILPAMMMSDQHLPHPINLRVMWSPLANSGLAGIFLGVLSGAFSISAYRIFHAGTNLQSCADRALSAVQTPLFWAGLANGIIIGALTVTKFHRHIF